MVVKNLRLPTTSSQSFLLILFLVGANFLILIGSIDFKYASSNDLETITDEWLDIRSIFSDIGVFIIVGILSFIGFKIRSYLINNSNWKEDREEFEKKQVYTNEKLSNAIELLVQDLKKEENARSKEIDELRSDFRVVNQRSIQIKERVNSIKEDIIDIKNDIRKNS